MAGPLQIGDIAAIARLAWDVYQYGFTDEHNASKSSRLCSARMGSLPTHSSRPTQQRIGGLHQSWTWPPPKQRRRFPLPTVGLSLRGITASSPTQLQTMAVCWSLLPSSLAILAVCLRGRRDPISSKSTGSLESAISHTALSEARGSPVTPGTRPADRLSS